MPEPLTPIVTVALADQVVFCLIGLLIWGLIVFRPAVRKQPARLAPWQISPSDFLACACFVISGAFSFTLIANTAVGWLPHRIALDSDTRTLVSNTAMHVGAIAGAIGAWVYSSLQQRLAARLEGVPILVEPPRPAALPWPVAGLLTFFAVLPATFLGSATYYLISQFIRQPVGPQEALQVLVNLKSHAQIASFSALATVIAPIMEELVFRAGLFRYLRTRAPRWIALLLPALLFASLHVQWPTLDGLNSFLPLTVLAVVFSLAYERTGHIGVTIIAHALFNLNMTLLVLAGVPA